MKSIVALLLNLCVWMGLVGSGYGADEAEPNKRVFGKSEEVSYAGKVVVIKVGEKDLVNKHAFKFWRRTLERVNDEGAKAVVFDLHTPGGLAMDTAELIMVDMQKIKVPSYAFVNQKALSAGALVSAGTDAIYMHPVSAIGAAALVSSQGEIPEVMRSKLESAFNAFVRAVAKKKGHNPDVILVGARPWCRCGASTAVSSCSRSNGLGQNSTLACPTAGP